MSTKKTGDEILESYVSRYDSLTLELERFESVKKERENLEIAIDLLRKELTSSFINPIHTPIIISPTQTPQPYMRDIIYDFLRNQGKPCFLGDICNHILSTGYVSRAKKFTKSVGTALYEGKKFKRVGHSLWTLEEGENN